MATNSESWDNRCVGIPIGWHAAMLRLKIRTRGDLKYLYSVAVDRLLSDDDVASIAKEAETLRLEGKGGMEQICARHTPETVEARHAKQTTAEKKSKRAPRKKGKKV